MQTENSKKRPVPHDGGTIAFQTEHYCDEQMEFIANQYANKEINSLSIPQMLFCDNFADSQRNKLKTKRKFYDQHSKLMGQYDISFGFGIPMFFDKDNIPSDDQYKTLIISKFNALKRHLANGADIVIPKPSSTDFKAHRLRYFRCGQQVIFHNIGSSDTSIPFDYIEYVQEQIHLLKKYAKHIQTVRYYGFEGPSTTPSAIDCSAKPNKPIKNHVSPRKQKHHNYNKVQCVTCKKQYKQNIETKTKKHKMCNKCLLHKKNQKIGRLKKKNKQQMVMIEELKAHAQVSASNEASAAATQELVEQMNQLRSINNSQFMRIKELEAANKQLNGQLHLKNARQSILGVDVLCDVNQIDKIVKEKYDSDYSSDGDTVYTSDSSDLSDNERQEIARIKLQSKRNIHRRQDSNLFRCGTPSEWEPNQIVSLEIEMKKQLEELHKIQSVGQDGVPMDDENAHEEDEDEPEPNPYAMSNALEAMSSKNLLRQKSDEQWNSEHIDTQKAEMQEHMIHLLKSMHSKDTIPQ
eukprot:84092_1